MGHWPFNSLFKVLSAGAQNVACIQTSVAIFATNRNSNILMTVIEVLGRRVSSEQLQCTGTALHTTPTLHTHKVAHSVEVWWPWFFFLALYNVITYCVIHLREFWWMDGTGYFVQTWELQKIMYYNFCVNVCSFWGWLSFADSYLWPRYDYLVPIIPIH
jgi:hypothetical protein